jgi:hypothetical protein
MRLPSLLALCLMIAACGPATEEGALSAADQTKAKILLADYEAARANGSWESAETKGDQLRSKYPDSGPALTLATTAADTQAKAEAVREERRLRDAWDYQAVPADGGTQRSAALYSRTVLVEEDQVAPIPDARLVLRDHPSWGRSAYLLLEQSKFDCGKPCALRIAFDDAEAAGWAGKQADSGKGPALFINDDEKFIAAMTGAKQVRITLPKGSGNIPSLVFDVGGYDAGRQAKP